MELHPDPARPEEPDLTPGGEEPHLHGRSEAMDLNLVLATLMTEGVRIGAIPSSSASKLGFQNLDAEVPRAPASEPEELALIARAVRRGLDSGAIRGSFAAEMERDHDIRAAQLVILKCDRIDFAKGVSNVGKACGILDEDSVEDLLTTPSAKEMAALAGQLLTGMVELQNRWERIVSRLSAGEQLSEADARRLGATLDFSGRKEILDRLSSAAALRDKLSQALKGGLITEAEADAIRLIPAGATQTEAIEKLDLKLEQAELRQAMASSAERTIARAIELEIIDEAGASEYRKIEDPGARFKAVKHLHVLADLHEEMEKSLENLKFSDLGELGSFDLLEFQKKNKGGKRF